MAATTCALCLQNAEIKNSHIIPKFVYDWIKSTSATGRFRFSGEVNKPKQDGYKTLLLCSECEQRFSALERKFASEIFYAHLDDHKFETDYDSWLYRFLVSLAFRILIVDDEVRDREKIYLKLIDKAMEDWRAFLLDENADMMEYEAHLIPIDPEFNISKLPDFLPSSTPYYMLRGTDRDVIASNESILVFSQIPGFIFFFTIFPKHHTEFENTKIQVRGRLFLGKSETRRIADGMWEHIGQKISSALFQADDKTQQNISKAVNKNLTRFENSLSNKIMKISKNIADSREGK